MSNSTQLSVTIINRGEKRLPDFYRNCNEDKRRKIKENLKDKSLEEIFHLRSEEETLAELRLKLRLYARKIKTGCKEIDELMRGGFPVVGITQISGESSCGKTQICLQIAITVQYPEIMGGLNAGAIYICTEDAFPSKRLSDLCEQFTKYLPAPPENINFGENVFIIHVFDLKQFEICLKEQVPNLISQKSIGLLIIDSIAGIFRYDCDISWEEKLKTLDVVARQLEDINIDHNVAVLCVNQVTTQFVNGVGQMVPSLGDTWGNRLLTKIELTRKRDVSNNLRTFRIVQARDFVRASCNFTVNSYGII